MKPLLLDELSLSHRFGHYHLRIRSGPFKTVIETDHNLGLIMSGFSAAMKELWAQRTGQTAQRTTEMRHGSIELDTWTIGDCWIAPYWWTMVMTKGLYVYEVRMDRNVEHVILAFQEAMKFFAFKCGVTTFDHETIRNRDRAGEVGLLTKEDFPA